MHGAEAELALVSLAAMLSPLTLSFSVLALVLAERPLRSGLWFYLGALTATMAIGIAAALLLGDGAAAASSGQKTWVMVFDVVAGCLLAVYAVRALRRPRDLQHERQTVEKMRTVVSSSAGATFAGGATLANAGAFIPIALKDLSQLDPTPSEYIAAWTGFAIVALLPLASALVCLLVAPEWTERILGLARRRLDRHARTVAAAFVLALGVALLRNGIAGLSGWS